MRRFSPDFIHSISSLLVDCQAVRALRLVKRYVRPCIRMPRSPVWWMRSKSISSVFFLFETKSDGLFEHWLGGGNSNIFYVHPDPWGDDPIWRIFFKGVETQPPTSWWFVFLKDQNRAASNLLEHEAAWIGYMVTWMHCLSEPLETNTSNTTSPPR